MYIYVYRISPRAKGAAAAGDGVFPRYNCCITLRRRARTEGTSCTSRRLGERHVAAPLQRSCARSAVRSAAAARLPSALLASGPQFATTHANARGGSLERGAHTTVHRRRFPLVARVASTLRHRISSLHTFRYFPSSVAHANAAASVRPLPIGHSRFLCDLSHGPSPEV